MDTPRTPHYPLQSPEADFFVHYLLAIPFGVQVDYKDALLSWSYIEHILRLAVRDNAYLALVNHPYAGLINIFDVPLAVLSSRPRPVYSEVNKYAKYAFALDDSMRRDANTTSMVHSFDQFSRNWSIFSDNCLARLHDWTNIVVAGGAIQICLQPLPFDGTDEEIQDYYDNVFPEADIDIFIWGIPDERAVSRRVRLIMDALIEFTGSRLCVSFSRYAMTLKHRNLSRRVQIVFQKYEIASEILAHFDLDSCCSLYNGERVWVCPRAVLASVHQRNVYNENKSSLAQIKRLAKYSLRGFEVRVDSMERQWKPYDEDAMQRIEDISDRRLRSLLLLELELETCEDDDDRYAVIASFRPRSSTDSPTGTNGFDTSHQLLQYFVELSQQRSIIAAASAMVSALVVYSLS